MVTGATPTDGRRNGEASFGDVSDLAVDICPLEAFAADVERHYRDPAQWVDRVVEPEQFENRTYV